MLDVYFHEYFKVNKSTLRRYGAFNVSLVTDLPLFIDPFHLFNSRTRKYKELHNSIIKYLTFLKDKSESGAIPKGLLDNWFRFPEVKQNWLGFTKSGNRGSGLGNDFATALHNNLQRIFSDFGQEHVTRSSHLEKLCLIKDGVGRDHISDFTSNLIKGFLCEYTEAFARKYVPRNLRRRCSVRKVRFNYKTEDWESKTYTLPWANDDYVLLTPINLLTKDDTWINKTDLIEEFDRLPEAIPNQQLREKISNYFLKSLPRRRRDKEPTQKEQHKAALSTIQQFPELVDIYIRNKEDRGREAKHISAEKVAYSSQLYVDQLRALRQILADQTDFYVLAGNTYQEAHKRLAFMKDVIENKGGHRLFYVKGRPVEREEDVQIAYRLTWAGTFSDVSREVNDGRGPADYKISRGTRDKTIIEFKLAKSTHLRRNLENQTSLYEKASDAKQSIKAIMYFSKEQLERVKKILKELKLTEHSDIVLIDARMDNKPSGSKA